MKANDSFMWMRFLEDLIWFLLRIIAFSLALIIVEKNISFCIAKYQNGRIREKCCACELWFDSWCNEFFSWHSHEIGRLILWILNFQTDLCVMPNCPRYSITCQYLKVKYYQFINFLRISLIICKDIKYLHVAYLFKLYQLEIGSLIILKLQ